MFVGSMRPTDRDAGAVPTALGIASVFAVDGIAIPARATAMWCLGFPRVSRRFPVYPLLQPFSLASSCDRAPFDAIPVPWTPIECSALHRCTMRLNRAGLRSRGTQISPSHGADGPLMHLWDIAYADELHDGLCELTA